MTELTRVDDTKTVTSGAVPQSPPATSWRDLAELNRRYLDLLAAPCTSEQNTLKPLAQIRSLTSVALDRMSQTPYALFSVRLPSAGSSLMARSVPSSPTTPFLLSSLMFMWYGLRSSPQWVAAMFELDAAARALLASCSAARLIELAEHPLAMVRPRWLDHSRFWPELIRAVQDADADSWRRSVLLGRQLLAAERVTRITLH